MARPLFRFERVGVAPWTNDLVVISPPGVLRRRVVYFGGDVQDYEREMRLQESSRRFVDSSLESTATTLAEKFGPETEVVAVRPSLYHLTTFSVFSNFVKSDAFGNPSYDAATDAGWRRLAVLVDGVRERVKVCKEINVQNETVVDASSAQLTLVGFSKGCVVLNQLLHETSRLKECIRSGAERPDYATLIDSLGAVYWLDGGHNGEAEMWVTDEGVLRSFVDVVSPETRVHVAVTPYQMRDPRRPWAETQKKQFCTMIRHLGLRVEERMYFEKEKRTIETHFEVLRRFDL